MLIGIGRLKPLASMLRIALEAARRVRHLLRCLGSRKRYVARRGTRRGTRRVLGRMRALGGDDGVDLIDGVLEGGGRDIAHVAVLQALLLQLGILELVQVEGVWVEHGRVDEGVG